MPSKSEQALAWAVYRPRSWGKPSTNKPLPRPWFGLDTERDAKRGAFVCGFAVGETEKEFRRLTDLESGTYWIWNLNYDIEGMLRDLNVPEGWAAKIDGASFPFLKGEARYFHGKRFDYFAPDQRLSFIEASSFFGRCPLAKIGKKYGQKEGVKASEMSLSRYESDSDYRAAVRSYCKQDARIVYNAVQDLDRGVRTLGVELGATPGATARRFLSRLGQFPDILWETQRVFLRSYCGGRFEITKRGVIYKVLQYDLVSAYPWALAQCPWLSHAAIKRWSNRFNPTALYGSYRVKFKHDSYLGVAPRWNKGIRVYSKQQEDTWLARPEVDYLLRKGADIEIIQSCEIFDEAASDLWRRVILELFALKQKDKESAEGLGAKIVLNSQYGVLIQLVRKAGRWVLLHEAKNPVDFAGMLALEEPPREFEGGKYYSPAYAAHLTSLTRVRLLEAADAIGEGAYIGGHTDSVLTTKPLPDSVVGKGLGDWKLEETAQRADICKTGMYALDEKVKIRGITRNGRAAMLWEKFHERKSRTGIKSASLWEEVSLIRPKQVVNNYTMENKRKWARSLDAALIARNEFIDSEALSLV